MMTLEDFAGKRGPFRDERGRFRRRAWDEMGMLGQSAARLAEQFAEQLLADRAFLAILSGRPV